MCKLVSLSLTFHLRLEMCPEHFKVILLFFLFHTFNNLDKISFNWSYLKLKSKMGDLRWQIDEFMRCNIQSQSPKKILCYLVRQTEVYPLIIKYKILHYYIQYSYHLISFGNMTLVPFLILPLPSFLSAGFFDFG